MHPHIEKIIGYNNLFTAEMIIKSEPQMKIGSFHARFVCHISSEKIIIPNFFLCVGASNRAHIYLKTTSNTIQASFEIL